MNTTDKDKQQDQWLGRLGLSAAQAVSSNADQARLSRPTEQVLRDLSLGHLQDTQRERVCAWLNQNPEEYEQWLARPIAESAGSWWQQLWRRKVWTMPAPLMMGSAAAVLVAVLMLNQTPRLQSDWMTGELETAQVEASPRLLTELQLPWEQTLGFVSPPGQAWQKQFTRGLLDARQSLTDDGFTAVDDDSAWYQFGRLNIVLSVWAVPREAKIEADWGKALSTLDGLKLVPSQTEAVTRLRAHLQSLQKLESGRGRFELARELKAQRDQFAAPPEQTAPSAEGRS